MFIGVQSSAKLALVISIEFVKAVQARHWQIGALGLFTPVSDPGIAAEANRTLVISTIYEAA